ncbi:MAG: hypothetical protein ACKV19_25160 [Verrucomicrobiales bacterium]
MKRKLLITLITLALGLLAAPAHERITVGPGDGRLAFLDSTATPSAEFNVKEGKIHITLLDKDLKPISLADQTVAITAGEKGKARKLVVSKEGNDFVAPLPEGEDYWCIFQLKEKKDAKAITFRVHYRSEVCAECQKAEWRCICGNKGSGKEVEIPADLKGLWAEINGHHGELKEALKGRDFAAIDEVTDAFPLLLAALPGKSGDKEAAAQPLAESAVKELAAIHAAGAARTPEAATASVGSVEKSVAALKKLFPADIANAKLTE